MAAISWQCPFCNQHASLQEQNMSNYTYDFNDGNKFGTVRFGMLAISCPNEGCKEITLRATLHQTKVNGSNRVLLDPAIGFWKLRPQSAAKPFPEYIPQAIRQDYEEASLILDLSPKASATLSRRCIQGMIRDYWKVVEKRLVDEINGIKDKVEPQTWSAIDAVRSIGNIGAHMEADINLLIDVDPGEAALLIQLIETLVNDWYVQRHERQKQLDAIIAVAQAKKDQQKAVPKP